MGCSVVLLNGIHCRPYADGAKRTSREPDHGESFFYVVQRHCFYRLRMAVDSTGNGPNALFPRRQWLLVGDDATLFYECSLKHPLAYSGT